MYSDEAAGRLFEENSAVSVFSMRRLQRDLFILDDGKMKLPFKKSLIGKVLPKKSSPLPPESK